MGWPDPEKFIGKNACVVCGECLQRCEFLRLSAKEAKQEIVRLVKGKETRYVLQHCRSCGRCNAYCPQRMDIFTLIVMRQYEKHQQKGLPRKCLFPLPLVTNSVWTATSSYLSPTEKAALATWSKLPQGKDVLYPGCAARLFPYLLDSSLFANLDIMGSLGFCGGGMHYQAGLLNVVEFLGKRIENTLQNLDIQKFVMICPSCNFMFRTIMPNYLDARFDFSMQSMVEWLWENIDNETIPIRQKVRKTAVVQEACHGKAAGQFPVVKNILDAIGVEIVAIEKSDTAINCCGMGDISIFFNPFRMIAHGVKHWRRFGKSRADLLLTYCPGCLLILAGTKMFYPTAMDIYHLIELVQLAAGEVPAHHHRRMAVRTFKGMTFKGLPQMLSTKRLTPREVLGQVRASLSRLETEGEL